MKIYHNPRCSKSRQTLQLIKDAGVTVEIVEYLKTIPTIKELEMVLMKLNLKPKDIIRKGESVYKEKFKNSNFNDDEWIKIMIEYPKLIERPIVIKGNKAIICRPPENVLDLIQSSNSANLFIQVGPYFFSKNNLIELGTTTVNKNNNIQNDPKKTKKNNNTPTNTMFTNFQMLLTVKVKKLY